LNLRKYDARKVIRNTPGLLSKNGSKSAVDVVALLTRLGVSSNSIARDKNALPRLLSRSPKDLFRLVAFLASDAMRMPMSNIGPLLRRNECMMLLDFVAPVPWIEKTMTGSTLSDSRSRNSHFYVLSRAEKSLHTEYINEIYKAMTTTAWALRNEIGTADLGKIIATYPSVLLLDAEKQILPTAKFLMEDLGIWEDDLPRVLQLYPVLLGKDISEMEKVVEYLFSLEVEPDNLSSILRAFPSLLTMNIERDMAPVVEFLSEHIGISNVGRFITRLPPVLGYSVDNELKPKWEYLEQITSDPKFEVSKFPAVFSYPLERIQNRFEYLRTIKGIPTQILSLDHVLCYGDRDFAGKVARDNDNGESYAQFLDDRKKNTMLPPPRRRQRQQQQQRKTSQRPNTVAAKTNNNSNEQ
jgi:mTERF